MQTIANDQCGSVPLVRPSGRRPKDDRNDERSGLSATSTGLRSPGEMPVPADVEARVTAGGHHPQETKLGRPRPLAGPERYPRLPPRPGASVAAGISTAAGASAAGASGAGSAGADWLAFRPWPGL